MELPSPNGYQDEKPDRVWSSQIKSKVKEDHPFCNRNQSQPPEFLLIAHVLFFLSTIFARKTKSYIIHIANLETNSFCIFYI